VWDYSEQQNYAYAPVDDLTRQTLIDVEIARTEAVTSQDFEQLKDVVTDLNHLL